MEKKIELSDDEKAVLDFDIKVKAIDVLTMFQAVAMLLGEIEEDAMTYLELVAIQKKWQKLLANGIGE